MFLPLSIAVFGGINRLTKKGRSPIKIGYLQRWVAATVVLS
jgi:hypothetical protein